MTELQRVDSQLLPLYERLHYYMFSGGDPQVWVDDEPHYVEYPNSPSVEVITENIRSIIHLELIRMHHR